jgi:3-oxoacyl-[acyl-carrier protein] reductase
MSNTVLVTGASRGIGHEICRLLVRVGHAVLGVHRVDSEDARALSRELQDRLELLQVDLSDPVQVERLTRELGRHAAVLAGVVLNAGTTHRGDFAEQTGGDDPLLEQLRFNLEAPLVLLRGLLRVGALANGASVVVVSSNLARRGLAGRVAYAAAKGGLESAVRSLARELGPDGIRVNAVAPGLVRTDLTAELDEAAWQAYATKVPLRRAGEASDVAPLVAFLLGPESSYITGQIIDVDGGWSA